MYRTRLPICFMFIVFLLTGCSSIDSDAKNAAELSCQALELLKKAQSGDMSVLQEGQEMLQKAEQMRKEFEEKYNTVEEMEEFLTAYNKHLEQCR